MIKTTFVFCSCSEVQSTELLEIMKHIVSFCVCVSFLQSVNQLCSQGMLNSLLIIRFHPESGSFSFPKPCNTKFGFISLRCYGRFPFLFSSGGEIILVGDWWRWIVCGEQRLVWHDKRSCCRTAPSRKMLLKLKSYINNDINHANHGIVVLLWTILPTVHHSFVSLCGEDSASAPTVKWLKLAVDQREIGH